MDSATIFKTPTYWQKRSRLEKNLISALILGVLLIIIASIVYTFYNQKPIEQACVTEKCTAIAATLIKRMDLTVDPCEDFYKFACGRYIREGIIPDDRPSVSTMLEIEDRILQIKRASLEEPSTIDQPRHLSIAKDYYSACMNTSILENISVRTAQSILAKLGGWPVLLGDKWDEDKFEWLDCRAKARSIGIEAGTLLDLSLDFEPANSSKRVLAIDRPGFGIDIRYLKNGNDDKVVQAYFKFMTDIAEYLGVNSTFAEMELRKSLKFEMDLAKTLLADEDRRNFSALINEYSPQKLAREFPSINWNKFINSTLPSDIKVDTNQTIYVAEPSYLKDLEKLLASTPKRVVANYLLWEAVMDMAPYLNEDIMKLWFKFRSALSGQDVQLKRKDLCTLLTSNNFPLQMGALYVRKYFDQDSKDVLTEMAGDIREQVLLSLQKADWMDNQTRKRAVEKFTAMDLHLGFPSELMDDGKMNEHYQNLYINKTQYLLSKFNFTKFTTDLHYNKLYQPVNRTDWKTHGDVSSSGAYYKLTENSLLVYAAFLQGAVFDIDRPSYLNYGSIGMVIGHEMIHSIDDQGRQFDKVGNLVDWWQSNTSAAYVEKSKCFIDQYDQYTVNGIDGHVNGINTQGENVADVGGAKLAYAAWAARNERNENGDQLLPGLANYTERQMFWVALVQPWCAKDRPAYLTHLMSVDAHAPSEVRMNGICANSADFADDWKCAAGAKMNPVHKCSIL